MPTLTVPRLRPDNPFTETTGKLTLEGYRFLDGLYLRVGGSLDALNAVTLADKTWDVPNPIGSTTPSTGKFTTLQATGALTVATVTPDSGGIKHKRVSTGSIGAGVSALVTVTWGTTFPDANYTVVCSVLNSTAATASLRMVHIETQTAAAITVRVENTSAGALTGTLNVIAMHD